jgi:hypothetical protein
MGFSFSVVDREAMISPTVVDELMAVSGTRRPISWENLFMNCRFGGQRGVLGRILGANAQRT